MDCQKTEETKLDTFGLMFYNNVLSLPFIALICILFEWKELTAFHLWLDFGFQFYFMGSVILAFLLNYFVFLTTTVNSPLTTNITGQIKALVSTFVGLFTFGGVPITPLFIVGLSISTFGGLWYGFVKYTEKLQSINRTKEMQPETGSKKEFV